MVLAQWTINYDREFQQNSWLRTRSRLDRLSLDATPRLAENRLTISAPDCYIGVARKAEKYTGVCYVS